MRKVKVLQIITSLGTGGAENVVFELCKFALKSDIEMHVLAFGSRDELLPLFKKEGINVDFIYLSKNIFGALKALNFLLKKIKAEKIDLIHAHLFHPLVLAALTKIRHPFLPICFTSHNVNLGSIFRDIIVFLLRPFRSLDIVFSKSQVKYIYKTNTVVVANGIDSKKYHLSLPKYDVFTFINIARLEDAKNHLGLIDIVKKITSPVPFQVILIGEGYLREQIQKKIHKNNLTNVVKLLGLRTDIVELCNKSHAFILPSLWEGMPIVLLEAGASGLPVISTPVGSIPSILNENNGYLTSIENFAETMLFVIQNYGEATKKGLNLQKTITEGYDTSTMFEKHKQIYLSLVRRIQN